MVGECGHVECEIVPARRRRRVDVQGDQVLAGRFKIGHLMDMAASRHPVTVPAAECPRPLRNEFATRAGDKPRLGRTSLDDSHNA